MIKVSGVRNSTTTPGKGHFARWDSKLIPNDGLQSNPPPKGSAGTNLDSIKKYITVCVTYIFLFFIIFIPESNGVSCECCVHPRNRIRRPFVFAEDREDEERKQKK